MRKGKSHEKFKVDQMWHYETERGFLKLGPPLSSVSASGEQKAAAKIAKFSVHFHLEAQIPQRAIHDSGFGESKLPLHYLVI